MAAVLPFSSVVSKGVMRVKWTITATADAPTAYDMANYPDKTVQWSGTNSNAVIALYGCNADTATGTFTELQSATGGTTLRNVAGTAAKLATILQSPRWIKPAIVTATANVARSYVITIVGQSTRR